MTPSSPTPTATPASTEHAARRDVELTDCDVDAILDAAKTEPAVVARLKKNPYCAPEPVVVEVAPIEPPKEMEGTMPEPPYELWGFRGKTGKLVGNSDDGYIGAFFSLEIAESIRPFLEDRSAVVELIGVSPRRLEAAVELIREIRPYLDGHSVPEALWYRVDEFLAKEGGQK